MPFRPISSFSGGRFARFASTACIQPGRASCTPCCRTSARCAAICRIRRYAPVATKPTGTRAGCAAPSARCRYPATRWAAHAHYRCADCIGEPPPFDATFALADYRAPLDTLAVGLKFRARLMLAREFAQRLARLAQDSWQDCAECPDVIAPVPLARKRLTERGYNQAWQIARPLARALKVRSDATLLDRVIHTAPQSRLDLDARRSNVGRRVQGRRDRARPARRHRRRCDDHRRHARSAGAHAQGRRRAAGDELRRAAHTEKLASS